MEGRNFVKVPTREAEAFDPLIRAEQGALDSEGSDDNQFDEFAGMGARVSNTRSLMLEGTPRRKRLLGFSAVALGCAALFGTCLMVQAPPGPLSARFEYAVNFICGGLPNVPGKGKAIIAEGVNFTCFGELGNWSIPTKVGEIVDKGTLVSTVSAECGGPWDILMPEDGVLTGVNPYAKPGEPINPGAQLALYHPLIPGVKLSPSGPGFKGMSNPDPGLFKGWKVGMHDAIKKGDPVADFELADGTISTPTYDGPAGMVLSRQEPLFKGDGLAKGADLITVGQALFLKDIKAVGDTAEKGDDVALVQVAHDDVAIPASAGKTVGGLKKPYSYKEPIGLDVDLKDSMFIAPADAGKPLSPAGPGFDKATLPKGGIFKGWKVGQYDGIKDGDPVAMFSDSKGDFTDAIYHGRSGMVMSRQEPLTVGDTLASGAELVTVGQALFIKNAVDYDDVVEKGDKVAIVDIAHKETDILASKDATVVVVKDLYEYKEPIPLDVPLVDETFVMLGEHLPSLPTTTLESTSALSQLWESPSAAAPMQPQQAAVGGAVQLYEASSGTVGNITYGKKEDDVDDWTNDLPKWLVFKDYNVSEGDYVKAGTTIAVAHEMVGTKPTGKVVEFEAEMEGTVSHLQPIKAGTLIGPHDEIYEIYTTAAPTAEPEGSGFPWWVLLLLLLLCLLCLLLLCCMPKKEEPKPEPVPEPVPVPVVVPEPVVEAAPPPPAPAPEPAPAPVVAPAPAPAPPPAPKGVPVYFDGKPYYLEYQPIGIKFKKTAPITVAEFIFNSQAKQHLGIKLGQRLTKIKDFDVREDHNFSHVDHMLLDAEKDLPYWPLRVDFRVPGTNEVKRYDFVERPLGILFSKNHNPIKIEKFRPNSLAQSKGVQVGWEIVRIADEDTTKEGMAKAGIKSESSAYSHVDKHLLEGLNHLPMRK